MVCRYILMYLSMLVLCPEWYVVLWYFRNCVGKYPQPREPIPAAIANYVTKKKDLSVMEKLKKSPLHAPVLAPRGSPLPRHGLDRHQQRLQALALLFRFDFLAMISPKKYFVFFPLMKFIGFCVRLVLAIMRIICLS